MYDIIVIGAGVTGTCTARELSKYQVNMCVIDKGDDVASGTSKANSGIVHGGYDCKPGTLMAEMNVRGNELLYELAEDLDYPIKKKGNGVYAFIIQGNVIIDGQALKSRDGLGIWDTNKITIQADSSSEILLMEIPMSI